MISVPPECPSTASNSIRRLPIQILVSSVTIKSGGTGLGSYSRFRFNISSRIVPLPTIGIS